MIRNSIEQIIEPIYPKGFLSYPYMIAIMAVLQVLCTFYGRKFIIFLGFNVAVGSLIFLPLVLYIFQIVSECYGWQYARQIVWCNFIVNGVITLATLLVSYLDFSPETHENLKNAYIQLMDTMWVSAFVLWIGIFVSDFTVSWLMCKLRFYFNGRFFFIRMILLHILSEMIVASGILISLHYNNYSFYDAFMIFSNTIIARTVVCSILLPFVKALIWFIQNKIERVVVFDVSPKFDLFKFNLSLTNSVQFSAQKWKFIDTSKIDLKQIASQFYSSHTVVNIKRFL